MFKKLCKAMLKEDNYMEAIAYCCNRLMKAADMEAEYERIDEKLWDMAMNCDYEDASDNALRILSALRIAIDAED